MAPQKSTDISVSDLSGRGKCRIKRSALGVGMLKRWTGSLFLVGALGIVAAAAAEKQYAPGVSDTEIKIGNTMPYSGAAPCTTALSDLPDVGFTRWTLLQAMQVTAS